MIFDKIQKHIKNNPLEYMVAGFIGGLFALEICALEIYSGLNTPQKSEREISYNLKTGQELRLHPNDYDVLRKQIVDPRGHSGIFKVEDQKIGFKYVQE